MRLIDRYVGSRVLIGIGVTLFIFVAIDFVSQIVDETDHTRGAYTFLEVLRYSVFRVPGAAIENLSFAALIGSLIGLGGLANHNELTVLRAAGVSTFRIAWSAMRACIAVILVGMFVAEWVAPPLEQSAKTRRDLLRESSQSTDDAGLWWREANHYSFAAAVDSSGVLYDVTRYHLGDSSEMLDASHNGQAQYLEGDWFATEVVRSEIADNRVVVAEFPSERWETSVTPAYLSTASMEPTQLSVRDLQSFSELSEESSRRATTYRVELWQRFTEPFAVAALVLVGISFVWGSNRGTPMGQRIFIGLLVSIVFDFARDVLGSASVLWGFSPIVSALLPVLIVALFGTTFLWLRR